MKVMITSFGVEHSLSSEASEDTMFSRMPPVSFRGINEAFMPDYELLVLAEINPVSDAERRWQCDVFAQQRNYAAPCTRDIRPDGNRSFESRPL